MNLCAIKKSEIIKELSRIPDNSLAKVQEYLELIALESNIPKQNRNSLKGIWKDNENGDVMTVINKGSRYKGI